MRKSVPVDVTPHLSGNHNTLLRCLEVPQAKNFSFKKPNTDCCTKTFISINFLDGKVTIKFFAVLTSPTLSNNPRHNKSRSFENMVLSYFQQLRPECRTESNFTTGRQKKNDCFRVNGVCNHCNTLFEAMGCYYYFCPCQEARPSLSDPDIERE